MGIFNEFFKKEKPIFTGLKFGFGGGGGGAAASDGSISASGGVTTTYTESGVDYKAHIFTHPNSDNFEVTATSSDPTLNTIEYIVVAGGGSGGSSNENSAGGGGGGGVVVGSAQAIAQTYICTVGDGGNALGPGNGQGANGSNSFFGPPSPGSYGTSPPNGISAMGGGAGAVQGRDGADGGTIGQGKNGGSGGGACYPSGTGGSGQQPTISQGMGTNTNYGNTAGDAPSPNYAQGTGGGGAGGNPTPADWYNNGLPSANVASTGGAGVNNKYRTGSDIMYGAGGGADGYSSRSLGGDPSNSTAGRGGLGDSNYPGRRNGADETGMGGGGAAPGPEGSGPSPSQNTGGNGGSGIIVVRYRV